jgi:osmotically-inducible protein OsmY
MRLAGRETTPRPRPRQMDFRQSDELCRGMIMNTLMKKIVVAGALIAAAASASAQTPDQGDTFKSPITVNGQRATANQRITDDVVNSISNDPRLAPVDGNIGVQTHRGGDVVLTGRVPLPGQAQAAGEDAKSVDGVRDVNNMVTPEVGVPNY